MIYFALSIFISAFLLFQVQPMIGKLILPWFGGTPAVWSTVMLFFQVLLTGGYAYAYGLIGRVRARKQGIVHVVLLAISVLLLVGIGIFWPSPITPDASWKPAGVELPILNIFKLLIVSVGLPYFVLSTNSPLMQAWFSRVFEGKSPYRLYALSNVGSFLALVSYPVLIEPLLTLRWQGWIWSGGYVLFALLAGYGAVRSARQKTTVADSVPVQQKSQPAGQARPSTGVQILWIVLSGLASVLLLAITNQTTQEVAVIPFLWVLPLTIYLLSFILTFSGERWYFRPLFAGLLLIGTVGLIFLVYEPLTHFIIQIALYNLLLFAVTMVCHGEMYRLRPQPVHLTRFYLMVSIGGALGGIFVNLVAPYIFKGYWELYIGIALVWLLLAALTFIRPTERLLRRARFVLDVLIGAMALSMVLFVGYYMKGYYSKDLFTARNFYGIIRVNGIGEERSGQPAYALVHGVTMHGFQFLDPEIRDTPTGYFWEGSGIGLAIRNHPRYGEGLRVGILGLGAGTLAAYGQPGDVYRFYEINPIVVDLATGYGGYFSFLTDSQAQVDVILGDARLSLEKELAGGLPQAYDILVIDTFSSDAIPVHLVTRESFTIYLEHLAPDGLIAANITNQHLDLRPVLWQIGQNYGLRMVVIQKYVSDDTNAAAPSMWVLMARNPALLEIPAIASQADFMEGFTTPIRLWTDDYSNLFQILK